MKLEELIEITLDLFYAESSSYYVILSIKKELLELLNPSRDIKSIDYNVINKYIKCLRNKGNSNATINLKVAYLSKILTYAEKNNLIVRKPFIPRFKVMKKKTQYLTRNCVANMLLWCRKNCQKDLQKIILIGYYTGLRINNILSVSKSNIEGDNLAIYDKKTNSNFILPISKKIRYIIEGLDGFEINYNRVYYIFNLMKAELGLDKDISIHTLRHSFCSTLNEKGVPLPIIQRLANHKNIQTTMFYTHTNIEQCKTAINML